MASLNHSAAPGKGQRRRTRTATADPGQRFTLTPAAESAGTTRRMAKPDPTLNDPAFDPPASETGIEQAVKNAVACVRILAELMCPHTPASAIVIVPAPGLPPVVIPTGKYGYVPASLADTREHHE